MYRRVHNINELIPTTELTENDNENKENTKNISNNNFLYKINNFFTAFIPVIKNGISNTCFISSCLAIYTKYFLIYKFSKKTKVDYNYMVKNIASRLSSSF